MHGIVSFPNGDEIKINQFSSLRGIRRNNTRPNKIEVWVEDAEKHSDNLYLLSTCMQPKGKLITHDI